MIQNLIWNNTQLGEHAFESRMKAGRMIFIAITNLIGIFVTLGLFIPFVQVRMMKYRIESMSLIPACSMDEFITTTQQTASATDEGVSDLLDFDLSLKRSPMLVSAFYFDGKTSRRMAVTLTVRDQRAVITGDADRECPLADLCVSERLGNASRKVTFPDGAYLKILDTRTFNALLRQTGHQESFVVLMQQSWRATAFTLVATVAILTAGYLYGDPEP